MKQILWLMFACHLWPGRSSKNEKLTVLRVSQRTQKVFTELFKLVFAPPEIFSVSSVMQIVVAAFSNQTILSNLKAVVFSPDRDRISAIL